VSISLIMFGTPGLMQTPILLPLSPTPYNLALTGTTSSSTPYDSNYVAAKAIDGITTGDNGFYSASRSLNEYWQIDLGSPKTIQSVTLYPYSPEPNKLNGIEVRGSLILDFSTYTVIGTSNSIPSAPLVYPVASISFRYIKIVRNTSTSLAMSEVVIMGY
jgi:hypothetical protein